MTTTHTLYALDELVEINCRLTLLGIRSEPLAQLPSAGVQPYACNGAVLTAAGFAYHAPTCKPSMADLPAATVGQIGVRNTCPLCPTTRGPWDVDVPHQIAAEIGRLRVLTDFTVDAGQLDELDEFDTVTVDGQTLAKRRLSAALFRLNTDEFAQGLGRQTVYARIIAGLDELPREPQQRQAHIEDLEGRPDIHQQMAADVDSAFRD